MRVSEGSMGRVFRSRVSKVMERSESVRTTVPEAVAAMLGAASGSVLLWETEPGSAEVTVRVELSKKSVREH